MTWVICWFVIYWYGGLMEHQKLSAVVITYNRIDVIETCLKSVRFVDELIVVDKGSSDGTAEIGMKMADKFLQVPWSPTVEETRAQAVAMTTSPWIIILDDDELLNGKAIELIKAELKAPKAEVYYLPYRHYILGRHDTDAYYAPEFRPALFKKGAIHFTSTVHAGVHIATEKIHRIPIETDAAILHLSHKDTSVWIEKTNRYTSQENRASSVESVAMTPTTIMALMEKYLGSIKAQGNTEYLTAVSALRGVYDVVDAIKFWEKAQSKSGDTLFKENCDMLDQEYIQLSEKYNYKLSGKS